eukprot:1160008-Pelagomonas_calceolata.AAC.1
MGFSALPLQASRWSTVQGEALCKMLTYFNVSNDVHACTSNPPMVSMPAGGALCKVLAYLNESNDVRHKFAGRLLRSNTHKGGCAAL